jgi:hypothetical protein
MDAFLNNSLHPTPPKREDPEEDLSEQRLQNSRRRKSLRNPKA